VIQRGARDLGRDPQCHQPTLLLNAEGHLASALDSTGIELPSTLGFGLSIKEQRDIQVPFTQPTQPRTQLQAQDGGFLSRLISSAADLSVDFRSHLRVTRITALSGLVSQSADI
jgi:hypothetical protein